jgi:hypothetical protein
MWNESVSALGQSEGGFFLRIGLIISMLFSIPFHIYLGRVLIEEKINNDLKISTVSTGIFSSITIILTATFSGVNTFINSLHSLFTLLFWLSIIAYFMLFSISILRSLHVSKHQILVSFILTVICIFYLILLLIVNLCDLSADKCHPFGKMLYIITPTSEWIITFFIFLWFLGNSSNLLYKEKSKS